MVTEFISSLQCRERYAMAKRKRKELTLQEKVEVTDLKTKIQRQHCDKLQISFNVVKRRSNPSSVINKTCSINPRLVEMRPVRELDHADFKTSTWQCWSGSERLEVRTFLFRDQF